MKKLSNCLAAFLQDAMVLYLPQPDPTANSHYAQLFIL